MTITIDNRQHLSSHNDEERELRENDTRQLVHDLIGTHEEFFADPINRLDFILSQDSDDFQRLAKYTNAKLRGKKPHTIRQDEEEKGGFLPSMHTPSIEDKPEAFKKGYIAIQDYIQQSPDSIEKKIEGVAMATEALVIWVHPFNDGNGRTARFLAKLVEDGASNIDELVAETASGRIRRRIYTDKYATKESTLASANNEDIMYEEDEREEMRQRAKEMPDDVSSMYFSIQRLLENDKVRENTLRHLKKQWLLHNRVNSSSADGIMDAIDTGACHKNMCNNIR